MCKGERKKEMKPDSMWGPGIGTKDHGPVLVRSCMHPSIQVLLSFALNPNKLTGCVYLLN